MNTRESKLLNAWERTTKKHGMNNLKTSHRAKNSFCSHQTEWKGFKIPGHWIESKEE